MIIIIFLYIYISIDLTCHFSTSTYIYILFQLYFNCRKKFLAVLILVNSNNTGCDTFALSEACIILYIKYVCRTAAVPLVCVSGPELWSESVSPAVNSSVSPPSAVGSLHPPSAALHHDWPSESSYSTKTHTLSKHCSCYRHDHQQRAQQMRHWCWCQWSAFKGRAVKITKYLGPKTDLQYW